MTEKKKRATIERIDNSSSSSSDSDGDNSAPIAVSFRQSRDLHTTQQTDASSTERKKRKRREKQEREKQKRKLRKQQKKQQQIENVEDDNNVELEEDEGMFDPSLLEQIQQEEEQERREREKPRARERGAIEIQGFKGKHTLLNGNQKQGPAASLDRIRSFDEYHVQVQVRKENDLLSKRNYIDPELTHWMQRHFYDGSLIKRVPTVKWHSEKRSFVGPSKQFKVL